MPNFLSDPARIAALWYDWGVVAAVVITGVITLWIFFDSQRHHYHAPLWRFVSLLAALMVVPSAVLWLFPDMMIGLGEIPVYLAFLGIVSTIIAVLALLLYSARLAVAPVAIRDEALQEEPLPVGDELPTEEIVIDQVLTNGSRSARTAQTAAPTRVVSKSLDFSQMPDDRTREIQPQPAAPQPLAWLVVMTGERAGKEFRLGTLTDIGRDSRHNDVSLDDPTMSRQHARVRFEDKGFVIYDLASDHGVLVNDEAHQRRVLHNGDRVLLGQTMFGYMRVKENQDQADR